MKRFLLLLTLLTITIVGLQAQRFTDRLDRGIVAVPNGSGNFVSHVNYAVRPALWINIGS